MNAPYNAGDRKHVREAEKSAKQEDTVDRDVIVALMGNRHSRAWVWKLLSDCHIFSTSYTGNALNTAFQEGERSVGLRLLTTIVANAPEQYIQAMKEANDRELTADTRRRAPKAGLDGNFDRSEPASGLVDFEEDGGDGKVERED